MDDNELKHRNACKILKYEIISEEKTTIGFFLPDIREPDIKLTLGILALADIQNLLFQKAYSLKDFSQFINLTFQD